MNPFVHSFFLVLATATDRQLARYLEFLKIENKIMRAKLPKRMRVTPAERHRLLKYGRPIGPAIRQLLTVVSPRTFARWVSAGKPTKVGSKPRAPGRPRTAADMSMYFGGILDHIRAAVSPSRLSHCRSGRFMPKYASHVINQLLTRFSDSPHAQAHQQDRQRTLHR